MVSVSHALNKQQGLINQLEQIAGSEHLSRLDEIKSAYAMASELYGEQCLDSGEAALDHALALALVASGLNFDCDSKIAALLFASIRFNEYSLKRIEEQFGKNIADLVFGLSELERIRPIISKINAEANNDHKLLQLQVELLRKMLLAVVEDIRVVLLRLASRTLTLRYFTQEKLANNPATNKLAYKIAQETLAIYSPLANRLGVWELKWELEDRSFRLIHPNIYRKIASSLATKRSERELFINQVISKIKETLHNNHLKAEVSGRPKHIYSIWNKMQKKKLLFEQVYDIRAVRVIVSDIPACYAALGAIHQLWPPLTREFDDYIAQPKANNYRSLHTVVTSEHGLLLEVQIRTEEMHQQAELGIAAHWRYKEGKKGDSKSNYDQKLARLRQLALWENDTSTLSDWQTVYRQAALSETIYVITPKGKVIDLPQGSTAVDFAYRIHTELGHRCRGVKVNGALLPLNTPLATGQSVEIVSIKQGNPSLDWLNPNLGFICTRSARLKVKQWFATNHIESNINEGKAMLYKELQRCGKTNTSFEFIAKQLNFTSVEQLCLAIFKHELALKQIQRLLSIDCATIDSEKVVPLFSASKNAKSNPVLIAGVIGLKSKLAKCCLPAPPEAIGGFISREHDISVHRINCRNYQNQIGLHPERIIETEWNANVVMSFKTQLQIIAIGEKNYLKDISEIFLSEKIKLLAVTSRLHHEQLRINCTVEIANLSKLTNARKKITNISGVLGVKRL